MKKYIPTLFTTLLIILSCKTVTVKEEPKENIKKEKSIYGFIDENTFIINATGFPKAGVSENKMELSYQAAVSLAKVKTETAFIDEATDVVDRNKIKYIIDNYSEVVSSENIDNRYTEIIFKVEIKDLRKLLKNGNLDFLIKGFE